MYLKLLLRKIYVAAFYCTVKSFVNTKKRVGRKLKWVSGLTGDEFCNLLKGVARTEWFIAKLLFNLRKNFYKCGKWMCSFVEWKIFIMLKKHFKTRMWTLKHHLMLCLEWKSYRLNPGEKFHKWHFIWFSSANFLNLLAIQNVCTRVAANGRVVKMGFMRK